jgi:hypothetical protein
LALSCRLLQTVVGHAGGPGFEHHHLDVRQPNRQLHRHHCYRT